MHKKLNVRNSTEITHPEHNPHHTGKRFGKRITQTRIASLLDENPSNPSDLLTIHPRGLPADVTNQYGQFQFVVERKQSLICPRGLKDEDARLLPYLPIRTASDTDNLHNLPDKTKEEANRHFIILIDATEEQKLMNILRIEEMIKKADDFKKTNPKPEKNEQVEHVEQIVPELEVIKHEEEAEEEDSEPEELTTEEQLIKDALHEQTLEQDIKEEDNIPVEEPVKEEEIIPEEPVKEEEIIPPEGLVKEEEKIEEVQIPDDVIGEDKLPNDAIPDALLLPSLMQPEQEGEIPGMMETEIPQPEEPVVDADGILASDKGGTDKVEEPSTAAEDTDSSYSYSSSSSSSSGSSSSEETSSSDSDDSSSDDDFMMGGMGGMMPMMMGGGMGMPGMMGMGGFGYQPPFPYQYPCFPQPQGQGDCKSPCNNVQGQGKPICKPKKKSNFLKRNQGLNFDFLPHDNCCTEVELIIEPDEPDPLECGINNGIMPIVCCYMPPCLALDPYSQQGGSSNQYSGGSGYPSQQYYSSGSSKSTGNYGTSTSQDEGGSKNNASKNGSKDLSSIKQGSDGNPSSSSSGGGKRGTATSTSTALAPSRSSQQSDREFSISSTEGSEHNAQNARFMTKSFGGSQFFNEAKSPSSQHSSPSHRSINSPRPSQGSHNSQKSSGGSHHSKHS